MKPPGNWLDVLKEVAWFCDRMELNVMLMRERDADVKQYLLNADLITTDLDINHGTSIWVAPTEKGRRTLLEAA